MEYPRLRPNKIVYIGLRDVDPGEKQILFENGIKAYNMHDIDRVRAPFASTVPVFTRLPHLV